MYVGVYTNGWIGVSATIRRQRAELPSSIGGAD
jgi:hypothetical protein